MGIFDGGGVATVSVDVEGDLSKFKQDLRGASAEVDKEFGGKNGPFGKNGARIGTAMAAGAAAGFAKSITEFGSFEKGLNEVFTLIPDAGDEAFGDLTEQTKDFSKEFGVLPNEVIPALYDSISAGVSQDNVFDFLEESNKLAKAGATDLTTAVDGLTTGLNAYGLEATESSRVSDALRWRTCSASRSSRLRRPSQR